MRQLFKWLPPMEVVTCILLLLSFTQSSAEENNSRAKYYRLAHQAHSSLCKGNLSSAGLIFDSAFNIMQPFFTDLNNALYVQINLPEPDSNKIKQYLAQLQQKGICIHEWYKDIPSYKPYLQLADSAACGQVADTVLYKAAKEAMTFDQVLRRFSRDSLGLPYDARILPALDKVDSVNYYVADSILKTALQRGIPVEELIGYDGFTDIVIILLHNGPWGRYARGVQDSLAILGLMDSREISYLYDRNCTGYYGKSKRGIRTKWAKEQHCDADCQLFGTQLCVQLNSSVYITGINDEKRAAINMLRRTYYLPDVIEEAKIKAYITFMLDEGLRYPGMVSISYDGAEEEFEKNYRGFPYIRYLNKQDYDYNRTP